MAKFFIQPNGPRPDFRLVITFLWSEFHDVDTDGDSHNPASREWTELDCQNRECPEEVFSVTPDGDSPLILAVESDTPALAAKVAYFLATETRAGVSVALDGPWKDAAGLRDEMGDFDLEAATTRAEACCWRRSSVENPYPNLSGGSAT